MKVFDSDIGGYHLYILVNSASTLSDLDKLLRNIWLEECCGHLSKFKIAEKQYLCYYGMFYLLTLLCLIIADDIKTMNHLVVAND